MKETIKIHGFGVLSLEQAQTLIKQLFEYTSLHDSIYNTKTDIYIKSMPNTANGIEHSRFSDECDSLGNNCLVISTNALNRCREMIKISDEQYRQG